MLSRHDLEESIALLWGGALINDRLNRPIALVQWPREINGYEKFDPVQLYVAEKPRGDVHPEQPFAPALRRASMRTIRDVLACSPKEDLVRT